MERPPITYGPEIKNLIIATFLPKLRGRIKLLTSAANLRERNTNSVGGFELIFDIDDEVPDKKVLEVTLAILPPEHEEPQHVHEYADAHLIVTKGSARYVSGSIQHKMLKRDEVFVPKYTPHGFKAGRKGLEFLSISNDRIQNLATGQFDFKLI